MWQSSVVAAGDTVICQTRHGSWFHKTCGLEITTHIKQIIKGMSELRDFSHILKLNFS